MFFSGREVAMSKRTKYLHYVCAEGMQNGAGSIPVDEVIYFRSYDACTLVVTAKGEHRMSTPISELLALLDPEKFWQVHRFTVVNRARIETVKPGDQEHLVMKFRDRDECMTVGAPYCRQFQVK